MSLQKVLSSSQSPSLSPNLTDASTSQNPPVSIPQSPRRPSSGGVGFKPSKYDEILAEAKTYYRLEKPNFLTALSAGETSRVVYFTNGGTGKIHYEHWDEGGMMGFWTLRLANGEKRIVKYISKGNGYRVWLGVEEGFDTQIIAKTKLASTRNRRMRFSDDDSEDGDKIGVRSLRDRKRSQLMPYTVEKSNHKLAMQGKPPKRNSYFDDDYAFGPSSQRTSEGPAKAKKQRSGSNSEPQTLTPSWTQELPPLRNIMDERTTFYVRCGIELDSPAEIVILKDCTNIDDFFREVRHASCVDDISRLTVTFPWLQENATIYLREDRPVSFEKMVQEITDAPCWKTANGKCSVKVQVISSSA